MNGSSASPISTSEISRVLKCPDALAFSAAKMKSVAQYCSWFLTYYFKLAKGNFCTGTATTHHGSFLYPTVVTDERTPVKQLWISGKYHYYYYWLLFNRLKPFGNVGCFALLVHSCISLSMYVCVCLCSDRCIITTALWCEIDYTCCWCE